MCTSAGANRILYRKTTNGVTVTKSISGVNQVDAAWKHYFDNHAQGKTTYSCAQVYTPVYMTCFDHSQLTLTRHPRCICHTTARFCKSLSWLCLHPSGNNGNTSLLLNTIHFCHSWINKAAVFADNENASIYSKTWTAAGHCIASSQHLSVLFLAGPPCNLLALATQA